jgi:ubiquinone/menaquinone biosynthesis C-methylase UbiE
MEKDPMKPDWSDKCWKEMLVYQRKGMWLEDTVDKLAGWMKLTPGMTAVDVGCGLGYLGYTYWKYFGEGGHYIGIDNDTHLIDEAREASRDWAVGGKATFRVGDAYELPIDDNSVDWAMCQTLLMHLERPNDALAEMVRIVRPGGLITCNEPDNHRPTLGEFYNSLPELTPEEQMLKVRVLKMSHEGRMKLGRGDDGVGPRVARMLKLLGMVDIDVRSNDRAHHLEPPYDSELQQLALDKLKKQLLDKDRFDTISEMQREEFLAGGGDLDEYLQYQMLVDRQMATLREQIEAGEYFACSSGGYFYAVKATKPAV